MNRFSVTACLALLSVLSLVGTAIAQEGAAADRFAALNWQFGPTQGDLGEIATISVPRGHRFLGRADAGRFMEMTENPSNGSELGVLVSDDASWFVVFEFSPEGYVKDNERLNADDILAGIREGNDQANEIRRERGWPPLEVIGWQQQPFYDPQTNNLTWSIRGSSQGDPVINHSTRLLGRRGVMRVDLVLSPEEVGTAVPQFDSLMTAFSFNQGHRYAEFTRGDKVAEYGLSGLIVGGAGVALAKTGLLKKLWKLIVFAFIALAGGIRKLVSGSRRRGEALD